MCVSTYMIYWGVYVLRALWPKSRSASRSDGLSNCDKDPGLNCAVGALDCLFCLEKVATGWLILAQTSVSCQWKQCRNAGEGEKRQSSPIMRQSRPVPVLMHQSTNFELFWNLLDTNNVNVVRRICIEGTDQQTQINHCCSFLLHLLVFPPAVEKLHGLPGALVLQPLFLSCFICCTHPPLALHQHVNTWILGNMFDWLGGHSNSPNTPTTNLSTACHTAILRFSRYSKHPNNPLINITTLSPCCPDIPLSLSFNNS